MRQMTDQGQKTTGTRGRGIFSKLREVFRNMGPKSVLASTIIFLLALATTCFGGYRLIKTTRETIGLQGQVNVVQSARAFDNFLLVRKNTVHLASEVVSEMIREGIPTSEILNYLISQSLSIKKTIDKDYTGLYGWINEEYCDGIGWVPDENYMPVERPWYLETMADNSEVTFVRPYLDDQTKTVLTTMACKLSDGVSVLALDVPLKSIQSITEEIAQKTLGGFGIVLDKTGRVIAHSDSSELGKDYQEETGTLGAALVDRLFRGSEQQFELSFDGQKYLVFAETIEGGWHAVSLINTRIMLRPVMRILSILMLFTVLEGVFFIWIIYVQNEKKMALASAEAERSANRAKSQFLSRMSHEIRTPINAIIGLDSLALNEESLSPRIQEKLNKIGASARHLLSIINDILDMSRIESGKIVVREEAFSFDELLEQVNIIIGGQCEDRGLTYECIKENSVGPVFVGDQLKLRQIIINILGNAVKFTDPPGMITFLIRQEAAADGKVQLFLVMKDTGIGMDPDYLPRLFDAFSQEDAGNTSRFGGSGLGLSITSSFVRLCGGEIHVESEKGVGTTFRVQLPYKLGSEADLPVNFIRQTEEAKTPQGAPGKKEGSERIKGIEENKGLQGIEENKEIDSPSESFSEMTSISGMRVLIAEDQEMNAEILMELLELEDVNAEWAADGQQAVKMFEKSEVGHFDVILMDMRMPVMDGLTATRIIRNLDRPDAKIVPIIALSANAFEEDVQQCLASGMNMHLAKPVEFALLKEALVKMRKKDR